MRRCILKKHSRTPDGQHFTACPHPALPAQASLLSHPRIGCCLRHARPTRSSTGTACAANVVHLHPRIWISRVKNCRRQAPSPSVTSVGCCRRRAPSASSVGELRRRAPSACAVGLRRRPRAVGLCRRPVPSACAVGLRRRLVPSAYADSRVPSPPRSTDAILSHRSIDWDRVSATCHGLLRQQPAQYACPPAHFAAALQPPRRAPSLQPQALRSASAAAVASLGSASSCSQLSASCATYS